MSPRLADAHAVKASNKAICFIFIFYIIIHLRSGGNSFYNVKKQEGKIYGYIGSEFYKIGKLL